MSPKTNGEGHYSSFVLFHLTVCDEGTKPEEEERGGVADSQWAGQEVGQHVG